MFSRREFLRKGAFFTGFFPFVQLFNPLFAEELEKKKEYLDRLKEDFVEEEDFWSWVKEQYTVSPNLLNLNNGGVSPQPKCVQEAHIRYYQMCNEGPSYYMWRILDQGREALRSKLADLAGCSKEEIAINRNATEALNTVIFGLDLSANDEVVLTKQDYPNMINAWKQRERRDKVALKWVDLPIPSEDENTIVNAYLNQFTNRTKVVHITHMINWNGQVIPPKRIVEEAHKRGIWVLLDSAHTFAHLDYTFPDTGCDFSGTSLHKWLCAPFGSGLLYIKQANIEKVWSLLGSSVSDKDIRKFETLGTRSFASEMAIGVAVDFHHMIGSKRKEQRLRYLKNYWVNKVRDLPNVQIHTPMGERYSGALALFSIKDKEPQEVEQALLEQHKIHTVAIEWENFKGVRVTPNVYTSLKDLDRLVNAIHSLAKK